MARSLDNWRNETSIPIPTRAGAEAGVEMDLITNCPSFTQNEASPGTLKNGNTSMGYTGG